MRNVRDWATSDAGGLPMKPPPRDARPACFAFSSALNCRNAVATEVIPLRAASTAVTPVRTSGAKTRGRTTNTILRRMLNGRYSR
jgi:hypothetical protein